MTIKRRKVTDYQPNPNNHNVGSERGSGMLEQSFRDYGAGRSLLVDKHGVIIAGNQSQQGALNAGIDKVIEIETDGSELVVVRRKDLDLTTDSAAVQLGYMDNRASDVSFTLDVDQLAADIQAGVDLSTMYTAAEIAALLESSTIGLPDFDEPIPLSRFDVPDALFPTDNDYGIPVLDLNLQGDAVDLPVEIWGEQARSKRMNGTYLFYTADDKFEALWSDPTPVINSGCVNAGEPNFTCGHQMPKAVALYHIYRKRWIARYWQAFGKRIFVDLNVPDPHFEVNWLGVPVGWKAYCTRGYAAQIEGICEEYDAACEHAQTSSIVFVVYGGGKTVKEAAKKNNWVWFDEVMNRGKK
jgi:hypothetical protein